MTASIKSPAELEKESLVTFNRLDVIPDRFLLSFNIKVDIKMNMNATTKVIITDLKSKAMFILDN
jgi:hypothetical protein